MSEDAARDELLLAEQFEGHRARLRAVARRVLGSAEEAEDAVQEAWLRLQRSDATAVEDLGAWLTTVVGRTSLDLLRRRGTRREEPLDLHTVEAVDDADPERDAVLADAVSVALQAVLDALGPAERVAFVLHDLFAVPFADVAAVLDRSPVAVRQLASRARRRVQSSPAGGGAADAAGRERVVRAFLRAARDGDLAGLLAVLDPDVVLRTDSAVLELGAVTRATGSEGVARAFVGAARSARAALLDGAAGAVFVPDGRVRGALELVVSGARIAAVEVVTDPAVLDALDVVLLER